MRKTRIPQFRDSEDAKQALRKMAGDIASAMARPSAKALLAARNNRRAETQSSLLDALRKSDEALLVETMNNVQWTPRFLRSLAKLADVSEQSRGLSVWTP